MFKLNKKLFSLEHLNNTPLLPSNSKGESQQLRIKKIEQKAILGKKIKSLFDVNYNKSAKSCNPCMNACKKVNKKINGRKLSTVNINEIKEIMKVFSS